MACTSISVSSTGTTTTRGEDSSKQQRQKSLSRSISSNNLSRSPRFRRAHSDNNLCYSVNRAWASMTQPKLKNSRSMGIFNFSLPGSVIPDSLKSLLFDPETSTEEVSLERDVSMNADEVEQEKETKKRANWIERILEIRGQWIRKQEDEVTNDARGGEKVCDEDDGNCEVDYSDDEEEEMIINHEVFTGLLRHVSGSDTKLFSQLAFLCNMAYVIPEIEADDLKRYYDLTFVTSSLEKKALAEAIKAKFDQDSVRVTIAAARTNNKAEAKSRGVSEDKRSNRSSVAYEIAASAATYVQSHAKDLSILESEAPRMKDYAISSGEERFLQVEEGNSSPRIYNSEMAAYVAAQTMTAVVAASEKEREEAARNLQSLHSSPCEWFICDDTSIYTRCFVIQGSDSLASWQANLFFEPTEFEGTGVLVHRGIYEAAKGIYEQFMPDILEHLEKYGERAKLQFTGHSLGGSLSLLVHLMLLTRKVVKPSALRPVVTFGSPFVFCGGRKVLEELGIDESHVHSVMMHRDIVPRAFSCNYPNHIAQLLKRVNGAFRSHPCLNKNKVIYTPMGTIFILQPDERSSPPHPLLPPGNALYALENTGSTLVKNALRVFLNSPHPIETLRHPAAYGSDGTILRDHDSSNYLKEMNKIIRQHTKMYARRARKQRHILWPLLNTPSPHVWSQERILDEKRLVISDPKRLISTEEKRLVISDPKRLIAT